MKTEDIDEQIERLLDSLGESTVFATSGIRYPVLPGLEVEGFGGVGLPVSPEQARSLAAVAKPAPFGLGEETVYDATVRKVLEIDPECVSFRNPAWQLFLAEIVTAVQEEFGLETGLSCALYKLLVYEPGSFFAPHRDTEKEDGMIATLVVSLPSDREGGSLVIEHDGLRQEFDFDGEDAAFHIQYAAFYTDCRHEVRPVTQGHRIALVYNLSLRDRQSRLEAPEIGEKVADMARLLTARFEAGTANKLAIPLQHTYSDSGLTNGGIKGRDRAWVDLLVRASRGLGYACNTALLTYYQTGPVEDDGGWGHPGDPEDAEMAEVTEESVTLSSWFDADGREAGFGAMSLEDEDLLSGTDLEDLEMKQEVGLPTGNAGADMERWYRAAVVVIWPPENEFRVFAEQGPGTAVPELERFTAASDDDAYRDQAIEFADAILDNWSVVLDYGFRQHNQMLVRMTSQVAALGDLALAKRMLEVIASDFQCGVATPIVALCERVGWRAMKDSLRELFSSLDEKDHLPDQIPVVRIFAELCRDLEGNEARFAVCRDLADPVFEIYEAWAGAAGDVWERSRVRSWDTLFGDSPPRNDRADGLALIIEAMIRIDRTDLADQVVANTLIRPKLYPLDKVLVPALEQLAQSPAAAKSKAFDALFDHTVQGLAARTETPVRQPEDWVRDAELRCTCPECAQLSEFLADPRKQDIVIRANKSTRRHVEDQIEMSRSDLDTLTVKTGRPHGLRCIKNLASYRRRVRQYEEDLENLAELRSIRHRSASAGAGQH